MTRDLRTPICEQLGIHYPIFSVGFGLRPVPSWLQPYPTPVALESSALAECLSAKSKGGLRTRAS